jgi:hypothetical protein
VGTGSKIQNAHAKGPGLKTSLIQSIFLHMPTLKSYKRCEYKAATGIQMPGIIPVMFLHQSFIFIKPLKIIPWALVPQNSPTLVIQMTEKP